MKPERMQPETAWSHPLVVAELPPEGVALKLVPGESERASLARHVGVLALPALTADLKATPDGKGGVAIEGDLAAAVRQTCVVSLEPFDNAVNEHIALNFLPESVALSIEDAEAGEDERDPADMIKGGVVDLGVLVTEFLALGLDPYPRRPGAVFAPPAAGSEASSSPFAELAKLKPKSRQED